MMRNIVIYILFPLISLSISVLAEEMVSSQAAVPEDPVENVYYEDSSVGSDWIDDQVIEGFIDGMSLPGLEVVVISDYRSLLPQIANISPKRTGSAKITKAFNFMAEKGSDPADCYRVLDFASWMVQGDMRSSADALGRSSLASKNQIKQQSQFLNRIRFNAELLMVPASA